MERFILIFLALAILSSMGSFLLFVPILPALTVTVLLSGLMGMFWLGLNVGRRPARRRQVESE
jgi:hypothetical protein